MAYARRRRSRKRRSHRRFKKRRAFRGRRRGGGVLRIKARIMPANAIVKLRYCEILNETTPTANTANAIDFAASGIFDPNLSLGGHQPLGRDEYLPFFRRYRIIGSRMKITCGFGISVRGQCGIVLSEAPGEISANVTTNMEQPYSTYVTMNTEGKTRTLVKKFSMKKFFGRARAAQSTTEAVMGSNPGDLGHFTIWFASDPGSQSIYLNIQIDYIVLFSDRKFLLQS